MCLMPLYSIQNPQAGSGQPSSASRRDGSHQRCQGTVKKNGSAARQSPVTGKVEKVTTGGGEYTGLTCESSTTCLAATTTSKIFPIVNGKPGKSYAGPRGSEVGQLAPALRAARADNTNNRVKAL